jgi:hypothetical protein
MAIRGVIPAVLTIACLGAAIAAQENVSSAIVSWKADKVEQPAQGVLEATGNVELGMASGLQLRADSIAVRRTPTAGEPSVKITAVGNVELIRGDERFRFRHLVLDPGTGIGSFEISADSE